MSTNFVGTIDNFDGVIESDEEVQLESDGNGGFSVKANGHNLSLAGVVKLILRRVGVSEGAAQVSLPNGESRYISSERSLGANDRAEEGTVLTPEYQGKAAQELLPHEEQALEDLEREAREDRKDTTSQAPTETETPSEEA